MAEAKRILFPVSEAKQQALIKRMTDCGLKEDDLEEHFIRSQGAGGQHVNKTSTCVELTHAPTGNKVKCSKSRSQGLNRYYARKIMCEILENAELGKQSPQALKEAKIRKQKQRRKRRSERGATTAT